MPPQQTTVEIEDDSSVKRRLILRDSVAFITLLTITAVLFLITLFLFRSFSAHRDDLAQRWSERGRAAIQSGHPEQAIVALRTALTYAPGQPEYELLLAQALGDAGHTEESYNYFLGLWETQPGSGVINLSLARLAARKKDSTAAIDYYHAAIYGTWEGDGTVRRRETRLELAHYLLAHNQPAAARAELLVAAGNAPDDLPLTLTVAQILEQSGFPADALANYRKALTLAPTNSTALIAAARLEYNSGDFEGAHHHLEDALRDHAANPDAQAMLDTTDRVLALAPERSLTPRDRVQRLLDARAIARRRFDACNTQLSSASGLAAPLQSLGIQWQSSGAITHDALLNNPGQQEATLALIFHTELQTSQVCGQPTGDDAALLLLAKSPQALER